MADPIDDSTRSQESDRAPNNGAPDSRPPSADATSEGEQVGRVARPVPDFHRRQWRIGNAFVSLLARIGVGPFHLLTVVGRKTGKRYTQPMVPVEHADKCWLVAPYGPVAWVRNVRASNRVSLRRGRITRSYTVREAEANEAAPVLKRYVAVATKTRGFFEATVDSPVGDFVAEASRHPVFELIPVEDGSSLH